MATKLVVLGIPWDVDTPELRQYMGKFGELDDCVVMKERSSGRSRGFGYVTFVSADDAKTALESEHVFGSRTLEVKIATPKEEMRAPVKKTTRIFVARIPHSVTESAFRSYFETFGEITDLYMPKGSLFNPSLNKVSQSSSSNLSHRCTSSQSVERQQKYTSQKTIGASPERDPRSNPEKDSFDIFRTTNVGLVKLIKPLHVLNKEKKGTLNKMLEPQYLGSGMVLLKNSISNADQDQASKGHRGIGFITFNSAESVENLMAETHELGGSSLVVDRATPKEVDTRKPSRMAQGGYGAYNAYINAATRYAVFGAPTLYDHPSSFGRGIFGIPRGMGRKIFVGRLPQEATADDLRQYFGRFGRIVDAYVPKDPKRTGHRGFGFVTFADDGVAERVSRRSHEIHGQEVAIDSATPVDDVGGSTNFADAAAAYGGYGPTRSSGRFHASLDFVDYGYGASGSSRSSRMDLRYRPY